MVDIREKREKVEFVVVGHICNNCGEECARLESYLGSTGLHAWLSGHDGSTHLIDNVSYRFDICEKCLLKLFNSFKIPPNIEDNRTRDDYLWDGIDAETFKDLHGD